MAKDHKNEVRPTAIPGGITDAIDNIEAMLSIFKDSVSSANAAFMTGKASDGATDKMLKDKVKSQKKSILGDKDSIYFLLDNLSKNTTAIKQISLNTIKHINSIHELLANDFGNLLPLIDILNSLNTINNSINAININEKENEKNNDSKLIDINPIITSINDFKYLLLEHFSRPELSILESLNQETIDILNSLNNINKSINGINVNEKQNEKNNDSKLIDVNAIVESINEFKNSIYENNDLSIADLLVDIVINSGKLLKINEKIDPLISTYKDSMDKLFEINKEIRQNNERDIVEAKLKLILEGLNPETIEVLKDFTNINLNNLDENSKGFKNLIELLKTISDSSKDFNNGIKEYLKNIDDVYKSINKNFEQIIGIGNLADKVKKSNKSIKEALDSNNQVVVQTGNIKNDVKTANITINDMSSFLITASIVMSIGALIMTLDNGKFVDNALKFGITLGLFETVVIAPMLLFAGIKSPAFKAVGDFNKFVITCTIVMSLGALFMSLGKGKFAQNALTFGIILGLFEMLLVAPILTFGLINKELSKNISSLSDLIITCTIVMTIGALFVAIGGGKFVKNALLFGVVLGIFEALVTAPILMFKGIKNNIFESVKNFSAFIIVCTTIMTLGALFVTIGGGKFVKNALLFTFVLMAFESLVIAPFLIFNLLKKQVFDGIRLFTGVVITCTIIMSIGALFVTLGGGKFVKNALLFTFVLMAFESLVIAPFLLFNLFKPQVFNGLKDFTAAIFVTTVILLTGALVVNKYGGSAMLYALLLDGFVISVAYTFKFVKGIMGRKSDIVSLQNFGLALLVLHGVLITGATFIKLFGASSALKYALLLNGFVISVAETFNIVKWIIGRKLDIKSFHNFGLALLVLHGILITGATFIKLFGTSDALKYALLLDGFVISVAGTFRLVSKIMSDKSDIVSLQNFGLAILVLHGVLITGATFIKLFGVSSAIEYALLLDGFVISVAGTFKLIKSIMGRKTDITSLQNFGLAILVLHGVLITGATFVKLFGISSAIEYALLLDGFVISVAGTFYIVKKIMSRKTDIINIQNFEIALLVLHGILLSTILFFNYFGKDIAIEYILLYTVLLGGFTTAMLLIFDKIGSNEKTIQKGSLTIAAMALGISLFTGAIYIAMEVFKKYSGEDLLKNLGSLIACTAIFGVLFGILGMESIAEHVLLGSIVAAGIGVGVGILGYGIGLAVGIFEKYKVEDVFLTLGYLSSYIVAMGLLFSGLTYAAVFIVPGAAVAALMGLSILSISNSINSVITTFNKLGDISEEIEAISSTINKFFTIPSNIEFNAGDILKLMFISNFSDQISQVIGEVGESVYKISSLLIPDRWDKNGKAVHYRQMNQSDFDNAAQNTSLILSTMIGSLIRLYSKGQTVEINGEKVEIGPLSEYCGIFTDLLGISPLQRVLKLSMDVSNLIGSVGENIGFMAKLQIPEYDTRTGKIKKYRTLNKEDFSAAAEGISTILSTTFATLAAIYACGTSKDWGSDGTKNIFDMGSEGFLGFGKEESPLQKVLGASFQVSELIGNIGEGIGNIAKLQIPIKWDPKTGKVTKYRTLKEQDFKDMGAGINTILSSIFGELQYIYHINPIFEELGGNKGLIGWITGEREPSPIERVLGASLQVAQLIGNIGEGISKMATLQIPNAWDPKTGQVIGYKKLEIKDFVEAAVNVGMIVTTITDELLKYADNENVTGGNLEKVLKNVMPVSELISNMSENILNLASGLVADDWDKKTGKPIHYKQIRGEDYLAATQKIGEIVTAVAKSLIETAKDPQYAAYFFDKNGKPSEKLKSVVDSVSGVTEIISNITNSVIAIGKGTIPKYDKNGKVIGEQKIIYDGENGAIAQTKKVITDIIPALATALLNAKNNNADLFDTSKGSAIMNAVESISNVTQIASEIIESVIKIGTCQIPNQWNAEGKPIHFVKLNVDDVTSNINKIFSNTIGGLLITINSLVKDDGGLIINGQKVPNAKKVLPDFMKISESINTVISIVGRLTQMVVDIASCKIPTGFNAKGEATGYKILSKDTISEAKTNMEDLIGGIISITNTMTGNLSANFDENSIIKLNLFNNAFEAIGHTLSLQVDNSKSLNNNTHALQRYIKAVNTVDVNKIKPLTTLVVELNKLANKLGSLDKLSDSLSNKLSVILKELVNSLNGAKETINQADNLQKARHKQIEVAITKVKSLLNSPLNVNVSTSTNNPLSIDTNSTDTEGGKTNNSITINDGSGSKGQGGENSEGSEAKNKARKKKVKP